MHDRVNIPVRPFQPLVELFHDISREEMCRIEPIAYWVVEEAFNDMFNRFLVYLFDKWFVFGEHGRSREDTFQKGMIFFHCHKIMYQTE